MKAELTGDEKNCESVWKPTKNGDWKLYFNSDAKVADEITETYIKSYQETNSGNTFKMGSLVMTPKGIGRLIKLENEVAIVKFLKTEEELNFSDKEIFSE